MAKKTKMEPKDILLKEFFERKEEKLWFTKLVRLLKNKLSRLKIIKALFFLQSYGMIKGEYGETEKGSVSFLYSITEIGEEIAKQLYKNK